MRLPFNALFERRSYWLGPITTGDPELSKLFGGRPSTSGVPVDEFSALNYAAVWQAVSLIASQVGSLPLILYKRLPNGGKDRFHDHPLYRLLHDEPNPETTALTFRETLTAHVLTWGNAYAEIERNASGRPVALWPLTPDRVDPIRDSGRLRYRVRNGPRGDVLLDPPQILHLRGLGFDDMIGYSVIAKARESIGLGLATLRFGGSFFGNGSTFGGVLKHPSRLSDQARQHLRESIDARHTGVDRAHRFILLQEGMEYERLGIPPEDAQFLQTRKFEIEEIARWFNLPPHKLKHLERSTNNNIEHQNIEYYIDCLRVWLVRWEQEINRKLVSRAERNIQFAEHLVEGLLRADITTRYEAYAKGRQWGWLSADDVLEKENMNPLPDGQGKVYLLPVNMMPADKVGTFVDAQIKEKEGKAAPPPPPAPTGGDDGRMAAILEEIRQELARAQTAAAIAWETVEQREQALAECHATREARAAEIARLTAERDIDHAQAIALQRDLDALQILMTDAEQRAREEAERRVQAESDQASVRAEAQRHAEEAAYRAAALQADADRLQALAEAADQARETEAGARVDAERLAEEARAAAVAAQQAATVAEHARSEADALAAWEAKARIAEQASRVLAETRASEQETAAAVARDQARLAQEAADQAHALAEAERRRAAEEAATRVAVEADLEAARALNAQTAQEVVAARTERDRLAADAQEATERERQARELAERLEQSAVEAKAEAAAAIEDRNRDDAARAGAERVAQEATTRADEAAAALVTAQQEAADARQRAEDAARLADDAQADLSTARALVAETDNARLALEQTTAERDAAVLAAHRALIADIMRRMIDLEADCARKRQATSAKLRTWMASFYQRHEALCQAALLPAVRAHLAWMQASADPETVTTDLVREHIGQSIAQLQIVLDSDPRDFHAALETTLRRWDDRADRFADRLLEEGIAYVRTSRPD